MSLEDINRQLAQKKNFLALYNRTIKECNKDPKRNKSALALAKECKKRVEGEIKKLENQAKLYVKKKKQLD